MERDVFHIMETMRPMRRISSEDVPQELIDKVLTAGGWAPSGLRTQPYRFIVVRDVRTREKFGASYGAAIKKAFAKILPDENDTSSDARNLRRAIAFGEEIQNVPVLLFVCGKRDWPFGVKADERVGLAPPSYGSVYPCVQNILLACRALGLGASLTSIHQVFEEECVELLEIPETFGIVAVIPIGYPVGKFGPVGRRPASEHTFFERWEGGESKQIQKS